MISEFVKKFEERKGKLAELFKAKHPADYKEVVKNVVTVLTDEDEYDQIDPERIHEIDDGDYQGTLLFVIAAKGYQPDKYWYVKVGYGSCSGCDTLQAICDCSEDDPVTDEQVNQYMSLALHIVQGLKLMGEE